MDQLVKRVDRIPVVGEELSALEQKEQVLRENYLGSLRKVEEAELAETLEAAQHGAQIEILEKARPPAAPKLSRWLLLAAGIAASLGMAVGVALLLELVDPVALSTRQLEEAIDRPVLGSLPRVQPG
jgi:capsular polysaccharide biosynthesis protein